MFLLVSLSKSKIFIRVVRVALVLYLCHARVASVSLVLPVLHSCCIPVARAALVSLVLALVL